MSDDHYVAQTYLRHFTDSRGLMYAYRKDGQSHPTRPKSVCTEVNGDLIPGFLSDPEYLKKYRAVFEPQWNLCVEALKEHRFGPGMKGNMAAFWAQLAVCTPTWTRVSTDSYQWYTKNFISDYSEFSRRLGKPNSDFDTLREGLQDGTYELQVEPDYAKAVNVEALINYAWALYNAKWLVLENHSAIPFFTSDNPASFVDQGNFFVFDRVQPFIHFLPLTPQLCLRCDLAQGAIESRGSEPNFDKPPRHYIEAVVASQRNVRFCNSTTIRCAEKFVFCNSQRDDVSELVERMRNYSVTKTFEKVEITGGYRWESRVRCIETP